MHWILIFFCIVQAYVLGAKTASIEIQERKDYEVLDLFFKMGVLEEEYGYVLEGIKPISARQFYPLDTFPIGDLNHSENEFKKTLLVREAIKVWNKLCLQQDRFVLKATPVIAAQEDICGFEIQFIHLPKLEAVIRENINLFRYVLGPALEVNELINKLAYSNERLTNVLQDDLTLIGIVLGFGSHNSIIGGRLETIGRMSISKDSAPYLPKSALLQGEDSRWMYGLYYLEYAGGNDAFFKQTTNLARPSFSFSTIQEEITALESRIEQLPASLQERPRFIFGAFKGDSSNRRLFHALQKAQARTKSLIGSNRRLEKILEIIGGKKPHITCDRSLTQRSVWSLVDNLAAVWPSILKCAAHRFIDARDQEMFKQTLTKPPVPLTPPSIMGASKEMLRGLRQAQENLMAAESKSAVLSKDPSISVLIPQQLYIKTLEQGTGEPVENINRLRLTYVIEDSSGNILLAHHDTWIDLVDTIPGFLHGVQGMRIGEKRTLFIHPALGYGALTTLPPCTLLVVHVQLLDADATTKITLPPATPLALDWLQDQRLAEIIERSLALLPSYNGGFYGILLNQINLEFPNFQPCSLE